MQFGLLHGTAPLRKRFTGRRRSVFLRTLLVLLVSVLHFRERITGIYLKIFADADYASKAKDRRSVSGGALCVEVHVYVGFPGRRNVSHSQRLKSTLPMVIL